MVVFKAIPCRKFRLAFRMPHVCETFRQILTESERVMISGQKLSEKTKKTNQYLRVVQGFYYIYISLLLFLLYFYLYF